MPLAPAPPPPGRAVAERPLRRLVVATANRHKLEEFRALIGDVVAGLDLVAMADLGVAAPEEDGATFADNALAKARACVTATGLPSVADDSGIEVAALDGAPGVRSARFAGEPSDDAANNLLLLVRLAACGASTPAQRRATFVTAVALVTPEGDEQVVHGRMDGRVVDAPRGSNGFGYDPLFVADDSADGRTNGELAPHEKDAISHRGRALRALRPALVALFED
jgi:XTP/dITP diphosphohydrolase